MNTHISIIFVQPILFIISIWCTWQLNAYIPHSTIHVKKYSPVRFKATATSIESKNEAERESLIDDLLKVARTHGPIGIESSETSQREIVNIADKLKCHSLPDPSSYPLRGTHSLLYSQAHSISKKSGEKKGSASAGRLGPFVGRVTQEFVNDKDFRNIVQFFGGFLKVVLNARREVLDDQKLQVKFQSMSFVIGGMQVKEMDTKGQGVWKVLFVGDHIEDGKRILVRVMETPSLFVLVQDL